MHATAVSGANNKQITCAALCDLIIRSKHYLINLFVM